MRHAVARFVIIVGTFVVSAAIPGASGAQVSSINPGSAPDRALVTAVGRGEVHIAPDHALIMIFVETRDSSARGAAADNARRTSATVAALHGAGVADSAIVASGFSVSVDFRTLPPTTGTIATAARGPTFVARNTMRVSVASLPSVGRVLDAALSGGATQIGQVQFTSNRMDEARRAALTQAVEHARADGETTARALGGTLGSLVEVTTQGVPTPGIPYYGIMSAPAVAGGISAPAFSSVVSPTSLAAGDVVVSEGVVVRWRFAPKP